MSSLILWNVRGSVVAGGAEAQTPTSLPPHPQAPKTDPQALKTDPQAPKTDPQAPKTNPQALKTDRIHPKTEPGLTRIRDPQPRNCQEQKLQQTVNEGKCKRHQWYSSEETNL